MAPHVLELSGDDPALRTAVECFYHAAPASHLPPTLRYRIERSSHELWVGIAPGQPLFGPAGLGEVFAWVEWRATDDMLRDPKRETLFLHAAGALLPAGPVLLLGDPGAGKSTVAAHLLAGGRSVWGDDLVRFAAQDLTFSATPRSFKLDYKSLSDIDLIRQLCEHGAPGTLLAPDCWYVSPAAVRIDWEAPPGRPTALVLLSEDRAGPARLEPMSAAQAALRAVQTLLGGGLTSGGDTAAAERLLEGVADVRAFRAAGSGAAALAGAIEETAS